MPSASPNPNSLRRQLRKQQPSRPQSTLRSLMRRQRRDSTDLQYNDPMQRSRYYEDGSYGPRRKKNPDPWMKRDRSPRGPQRWT